MIILRIKKRLGSKGSKGFLLFEKGLKGVDSNDDGFLNFEQFKTVVK
jgi:Ca2+-binding EF-hand superfamily protein